MPFEVPSRKLETQLAEQYDRKLGMVAEPLDMAFGSPLDTRWCLILPQVPAQQAGPQVVVGAS